ncbi:TPA: hypothetical protein N0F65_008981 [Lagenidium giganteum]|uniref:Amine oxidase domain-containing protein n=1 Tax=Lagenidium giganteum TaxID=4803 RepID=A0AAV2YGA6_9STRA|nr:TPA: hypothetical protein N0F65_008981 [Lagenidium giganteum]
MQSACVDCDVVIVGAGISGLRCAHQLINEHGVSNVVVVEAQGCVGGRVMQDTEFIPGMTIEVGAELLHGANTSLTRMAEEQHWGLREIFTWAQGDGGPTDPAPDGGIGYYYLGDQKRLLRFDDEDPDFCKFNECVADLSEVEDVEAIPPHQSMLDYFNSCNLSESMMKMADAGYANTAGSRLDDISLRVTCRYERQWVELEDEGDYRVMPTFGRIIDHFKAGVNTRVNWPVQTIDYSAPDVVTITSKSGEQLRCKRVVVTVPTSVFKDIEYLPCLPQDKADAVDTYGMRRAAKVLLQFNTSFWPSNTHGVICSDCFLPEFWVNSTNGVGHYVSNGDKCQPVQVPEEENQYLVTGFAGADCADKLKTMKEENIVDRFLNQLDEIYGTEDRPTPARDSFVKSKYFDWGDVEYINGGYSYPRVGQSDTAAQDLARSIENRVFFAGEATAFEQPGMTVHSAMDTGTRAARDVALSLSEK